MDPLSALRDFTIRSDLTKITKHNEIFHFGNDYIFPCSIETSYRSKQGNFYTLETLVHYIKNHHLKHIEYIQNSRTLKIPTVTLPDRKPLLHYLTGKSLSNDAIEFIVPVKNNDLADDMILDDGGDNNDNNVDVDEIVNGVLGVKNDGGLGLPVVVEEFDYVGILKGLEKPLKDREALLECRGRDFLSVLVASTRREEERQRLESQQRKDGLVANRRLMGSEDNRGGFEEMGYETPKPKMMGKLGGKVGEGVGVPIILVPSASQTLITIYNVKEFLEDGVFIPTEVKVKQMKGAKPDCVTVQKKNISRERAVTAYEVRDKPSTLKAEDWERVVALFVLGKEWQFKDWPFKDHVEIFNKIIGFFMRFEDDSVESAKMVKQWNVKIISISKNKRHQDRAAALEVWDRLEEFVRSRSHT